MKKTILTVFIISFVLVLIAPANAAASLTVTNNGAPALDIYRSEFDQLVMDITIKKSDNTADTLEALTLNNSGTAGISAISKVVVWSDAGQAGFQGLGIDKNLGEATWSGVYNYWYLSGLSETVPGAGLRIFVSIETPTSIGINAIVQMQVPVLVDNGTIGQFDVGDTGIFLDGATGPSQSIINTSIQTIRSYNADIVGPKTVTTDPLDGATITASTYKIKGLARDQAGSTPASVKISFNSGAWLDVTPIGANYSTWEYDWVIPADGAYTIKTQGEDWLGNKEPIGSGIMVTVNTGAGNIVSATKSSLIAPETTLPANGIAKTTITATIKNAADLPLAGKIVGLVSNRGDKDNIKTILATTDINGQASFEVKSSTVGQAIFSLSVDGTVIDKSITINFTTASFGTGDLIKGSLPAVYYYGANGKRYVFPNEKTYMTWYADFGGVKIISDAELSAIQIGGNVTYKPGVKMVKITTDPKVYAVAAGGTLRWVKTEAIAQALYGANWSLKVEDIPDAFFTNYLVGEPIELAAAFSPAEISSAAKDINTDKGF